MEDLHIITDLQYGSTGKGLFAAYLADKLQPDAIVTAWAPNAGHTVVTEEGQKLVTCALPSGIFRCTKLKRIFIGPGSVINPDLLMSEMEQYVLYLNGVDVIIHPYAAIVTEEHRTLEAQYAGRIGSTMKGVGEAVISKIRRDPVHPNIAAHKLFNTPLEGCVVDVRTYNEMIDESKTVILEGAQGFSLSMNHGFYPYTTSRDCTTMQLMSDCGLPFPTDYIVNTYGVARTLPIRVNNRSSWSGPCYDDQTEIDWRDIGVEPELTTVTKLPRRLFTFSRQQVQDAMRMNAVHGVFLNFCNYVSPEQLVEIKRDIHLAGGHVQWTGWGPKVSDVRTEVEVPNA